MANVKGKQLKTNKKLESFTLNGKEYKLNIDFNVLSELEDVYGDIQTAFNDLQKMRIKAIKALVYSIVKVEDENVTLKEVGSMMGAEFFEEIINKIGKSMSTDLIEKKEDSNSEDMGE